MASFLRRLFGPKKKKATRKDSVTGRNKSFAVPYLSRLEGNALQPGQSLIVRGFITGSDENEFLINLTSGPNVEMEQEGDRLDNRLLSMRTDVKKGRIYLNACIDGEWGKEASVRHDWRSGDEFDIRVRCYDDQFHIFVEHKLVAKFNHYIPMNNISHIYVNGSVELYAVSWEGKFYQVPYSADIPGNFYPGRKLCVSGMISKGAKHICIDFMSGNDISFRFNPSFVEKKTLRNSRINGEWGKEERSAEVRFPLKRKHTFDILIYCEESRFMIYINDIFYSAFEHRLPCSEINKLSIEGEVELLGVHLK